MLHLLTAYLLWAQLIAPLCSNLPLSLVCYNAPTSQCGWQDSGGNYIKILKLGLSKMAEVTYPPAGAVCSALSTSRPCPGYCTARVGATVKHSRNQSAMVPLLGRASWPLSLFLLLEAAVARAKCGMLYHVPSIQTRNQVTHKVILQFVL